MITLDLFGYSFDDISDIMDHTLKDPFLLEDMNMIEENFISFRLIKL